MAVVARRVFGPVVSVGGRQWGRQRPERDAGRGRSKRNRTTRRGSSRGKTLNVESSLLLSRMQLDDEPAPGGRTSVLECGAMHRFWNPTTADPRENLNRSTLLRPQRRREADALQNLRSSWTQ